MRRLCLLLAVASTAACVWAAVPQTGKLVALLVGVKEYNHSGLDDLQFTERDVTELKKVLEAAGFQVTLLTATEGKNDSAKAPTKANIDAALAKALSGVGKHDLVLVALAGHGLQPTGSSEQFFCPFDANPDKKSNLVSLAALSQEMQSSGAGAKLLLVDACRNDPDPGRGRSGVEGNLFRLPPTASNFMAMFSCCAGQKAFETDKAGGGHGVFFFHVLEGLKGAAKDQHGEENEVTWASLSAYVQRKVPGAVRTWIGKEKEQRVHAVANVDRESVRLTSLADLDPPPVGESREFQKTFLPVSRWLDDWRFVDHKGREWQTLDGAKEVRAENIHRLKALQGEWGNLDGDWYFRHITGRTFRHDPAGKK